MSEKYIMVDLGDERTGAIAEAIANETCKKILNTIAEREMSESDLAKELKIPLNTVEYNIKKLTNAGLIEKVDKFFWSEKGKRIASYKVSNKKIVISPKKMIKGVLPAVIISGIIALIIKLWFDYSYNAGAQVKTVEATRETMVAAAAPSSCFNVVSSFQSVWIWFFAGALSALIIFLIWNWISKRTERRSD